MLSSHGSVAGACTVQEPGSSPSGGAAAYVEHVTPTARGGFGVGSLGVSVVCAVDGAAPEQVTLILPNLRGLSAAEPKLSRDEKTMFFSLAVNEADIWLVTLGKK